MDEVHLTLDAMKVDHPDHLAHFVFKFFPGVARPGTAAPMHVQCSCGKMFLLSAKPRTK